MQSRRRQQWSVVITSTLAFTVCFAVWIYWTEIVPARRGNGRGLHSRPGDPVVG